MYAVPAVPVVEPVGVEGVAGGLFAAFMVTLKALDKADAFPFESTALTFTEYVPAEAHWWLALPAEPELTRAVVVVWLSPQLKIYFIWSPSGSVVVAE